MSASAGGLRWIFEYAWMKARYWPCFRVKLGPGGRPAFDVRSFISFRETLLTVACDHVSVPIRANTAPGRQTGRVSRPPLWTVRARSRGDPPRSSLRTVSGWPLTLRRRTLAPRSRPFPLKCIRQTGASHSQRIPPTGRVLLHPVQDLRQEEVRAPRRARPSAGSHAPGT